MNFFSTDVQSGPIEAGPFEIVFKILTSGEWLEVYDSASRHPSPAAQELRVGIEALARAVITINGQPLLFSAPERERALVAYNEYYGTTKKDLTPVEVASIYLQDKFLLHHIQLFEKTYGAWMEETIDEIDVEVKKKRAPKVPGTVTSASASDSESSQQTSDSSDSDTTSTSPSPTRS